MEYQIELTDVAEAELDAAYLSFSPKSLDAAWRWYLGARAKANTLSMFSRRCPLARENDEFPTQEVRQLLYGSGRSAYRIIFIVFDEDAVVRVVGFRHGARGPRQQAQEEN